MPPGRSGPANTAVTTNETEPTASELLKRLRSDWPSLRSMEALLQNRRSSRPARSQQRIDNQTTEYVTSSGAESS